MTTNRETRERKEGASHTPLPWDRCGMTIGRDNVFASPAQAEWVTDIETGTSIDDGRVIARAYGLSADESRANAALIVRCVNSHADLLEACRAALAFVEEGKNPAHGCVSAPTGDMATAQMLRAAISAATEAKGVRT